MTSTATAAPAADRPAGPHDVRLTLLGPVDVTVGGVPLDLGHQRQRCVLAALAMDANRVVSREQLIDRIWDDRPPRSATNLLYGYLGRLRTVLGPAGAAAGLTRRSGGYQLEVDTDAVDLLRFRDLAARAAAAADPEAAARFREQALACWGGEPFSGAGIPWLAAARGRLQEERIAVVLDHNEHLLRTGGHRDVLGTLRELAAGHPADERVIAQYMTALHACGQSVQALAVFARTRRRLAEDLGLQPGPVLREVHQQILATAPAGPAAPAVAAPPPSVPRQLTAAPDRFTGRHAELAELGAVVDGAAGARSPLIAITGMPGIGKTALAVHWAHRVRDRFPDGQLHADLGGAGTARPVLVRFLRSLGDPDPAPPHDEAEAAARFRTLLTGRRVLIVVDDVAHAEQVRPFLPGSPGCLVLVTSRNRLSGLAARDGARHLRLGVLSEAESHALVRQLLEPARAGLPTPLVRHCGGLPLALRVAAAKAGVAPAPHDPPLLAEFAVEGDARASVGPAFARSYANLPAATRRMFRLLGQHGRAPVSVPVAARLAAMPAERAHEHLTALADAHLLEPVDGHRYTMHDLLRLFAGEQSAPETPPAAARRVRHRTRTIRRLAAR